MCNFFSVVISLGNSMRMTVASVTPIVVVRPSRLITVSYHRLHYKYSLMGGYIR